jgi:hypothetical protein
VEGNQQRALAAPALELDGFAHQPREEASAEAAAVFVVGRFGLAGGGGQRRGLLGPAIEIAFQFRCAA